MKQYSIRGAITVNSNTVEDIRSNTIELLERIIEKNNIDVEDCVNIIFTATKDITKAYPARFAREIGFDECPLMCFQEMQVDNSLNLCIRVMVTINYEGNFSPKHVYLKGAKVLRPDIAE